ncbi:MAG: hypothetical protein LBI05_10545 [Planctomycetaceae bacterium]|jgi:hypothetical protein|nr:hypothetical protein [Planctomycetaceae bacterium]
MRDIGEGTIRRIDWTELTPVVLLLRIFNISLGIRILLIALIALQLNVWLNAVSGIKILDTASVNQAYQGEPQFYVGVPFDVPYNAFADIEFSVKQNPILLLWLCGVILIWTICGGLISRIVAVRLTVDESEPLGNLLRFLYKRGISLISAPTLVLIGILCCFLPVKIAGWMLAVPFLNYAVAILFPIPFAFACLTVFFSMVLAVGGMLLVAAVSVDGSDGFDAVSRMFSYVCQRPLHYAVYWFCCGVLGYLGLLLVQFVIFYPAIRLCWSTVPADYDVFITFWAGLFALIPLAYIIAWFWTSSTAIYLLIRRSVDATPFHEIYRLTLPKVRTLPTIQPDERGVPETVTPTEPAPEPSA